MALAWVLGQGDHVVAIAGTTKIGNLETNMGALDCPLFDEERAELDKLADQVRGERYAPEEMSALNR